MTCVHVSCSATSPPLRLSCLPYFGRADSEVAPQPAAAVPVEPLHALAGAPFAPALRASSSFQSCLDHVALTSH
eukprot:6189244-Pleurochrysis_carterae.AAC.2